MPGCQEERKWFHVRFNIQNRSNGQNIFTLSSLSNDLGDIANSDKIFVRYQDCTVFTDPPRAWDNREAPGWFYFRPSVEDLDQSFVDVTSYEEVVDETNRRIFEYELIAAIDSSDTFAGERLCTATGPPDALCADDNGVYETIVDDLNSVVFRWPEIATLTEIGCCRIQLDDPGDPGDPPTEIRDCSRLWVIARDGNEWSLRYYDFEAPSAQALVARGRIVDAEGLEEENEWKDLAWDTRDFLWGLEQNGLKRILPGSPNVLDVASGTGVVDGLALAQPYATINDLPSGELTALFAAGIDDGAIAGTAAMSYSQTQEMLYIAAGDRLFELRFSDETTWDVVKVSNTIGSPDGVGDLAFDTFGNCFCVVNNDLAEIDFENPAGAGFGNISPIGSGNLLASMTGMDFILDLASGEFIAFYGVLSSGALYQIDRFDGTRTILTGIDLGPSIIGMSSCQAGEDLRSYEIPFFPGATPWVFLIDSSGSMSSTGSGTRPRDALVRDELVNYINDFVEDGEQMSFYQFGGQFSNVETFNTKTEAINYLGTQYRDPGTDFSGTHFCTPKPTGGSYPNNDFEIFLDIPPDAGGRKVRAMVFIGDGEFVDAGCEGNTLRNKIQAVMDRRGIDLDPDFTIRAVGVNPTSGLDNLELIGEVGGGGYIAWTE